MAADKPYGEFYDFYSVSPEYFGYNLVFRNKIGFYGEELLALLPTPRQEDHPLSAVSDCLFDIFAALLYI
jgi:hypothetical protein